MRPPTYKGGEIVKGWDGNEWIASPGEPVHAGERVVGRAIVLSNDDLNQTVYLHGNTIVAGCSEYPAKKMFRRLAKALGYEVEG